nr:iron chelate uptake ABC transporter family permease subunit [Arsenophonus endosymbiont of Aleurodicus floccissimus]
MSRVPAYLSLLSVSMLAAVAIVMAGPITFVGLVVPHLMRAWIGSDFRWLLPYSMLAGSCLLLISDVIARLVIAPEEVMVGIITAVVGAPSLYWVVKKPTDSRMVE